MNEARYYIKNKEGSLSCNLCPHACIIKNNKQGICGVRKNINGKLISSVYGIASAIHADPIEKKPLYHFYPGSNILSLGSFGCNFKCNFCQNHQISQARGPDISRGLILSPEEIGLRAKEQEDNIGLAFTYNEPVIWFEYMFDTAKIIKESGMKTALISNGYIQKEPLEELLPLIDAFNIDIKAFEDKFYLTMTGGTITPVLESIKRISKAGKHIELTNLIISGQNDRPEVFKDMIRWIVDNCGDKIVLHLSKYFPNYKSEIPGTPDKKLLDLYNIAREKIYFTYLGNTSLRTGRDTICPVCGKLLIERKYYSINMSGLDSKGECVNCHYRLTTHFSS